MDRAQLSPTGATDEKSELSQQHIASFLHFGFLPTESPDPSRYPWATARATSVAGTFDIDQALEQAAAAMRSAFQEIPPGLQVLPLSGGLDSRLILGLLLEAGCKDRIVTATFGTPGTLDFDIGVSIARRLGVENVAIDLTQVPITAELVESALALGGTWCPVLESVYNALIPERFGKEATYWSGYMANTLVGAQLREDEPATWEEAKKSFARRSCFERSGTLAAPGFDPTSLLPQAPMLEDSPLTHYEEMYLCQRYLQRYEGAMLPRGFSFRTPFLHAPWLEVILHLPREERLGQKFYRQVGHYLQPELTALPTKSNRGLSLNATSFRSGLERFSQRARRITRDRFPVLTRRPHPMVNYIDTDVQIRESTSFRDWIGDAVTSLRRRGCVDWVDGEALLQRHLKRQSNHGDALVLLASLEANLRFAAAPGAAPGRQ